MPVHQRIKAGRERLGLTHMQFANRLGVTRGAVQQWERADGTAPKRSNQAAVAALLGISISELMNPGEIGPMPSKATQDTEPKAMSFMALELAHLFELLPDDRVIRTLAYNAATDAILRIIQGRSLPSYSTLANDG